MQAGFAGECALLSCAQCYARIGSKFCPSPCHHASPLHLSADCISAALAVCTERRASAHRRHDVQFMQATQAARQEGGAADTSDVARALRRPGRPPVPPRTSTAQPRPTAFGPMPGSLAAIKLEVDDRGAMATPEATEAPARSATPAPRRGAAAKPKPTRRGHGGERSARLAAKIEDVAAAAAAKTEDAAAPAAARIALKRQSPLRDKRRRTARAAAAAAAAKAEDSEATESEDEDDKGWPKRPRSTQGWTCRYRGVTVKCAAPCR